MARKIGDEVRAELARIKKEVGQVSEDVDRAVAAGIPVDDLPALVDDLKLRLESLYKYHGIS